MAELGWLFNALFPRSCVRCGREGALCCADCKRRYPFTPPEATSDHLAPFAYGNPLVRDIIKAWKYDCDASAWDVLRTSADGVVPRVKHLVGQGNVAIVPIPLSARRLCERGFNQSMVVARWLGRELNLPVVDALARQHSSTHQAALSTEQRQEITKASPFLLKENSLKDYSTILLVDDVFTTGSTLSAARSTLLSKNITQVFSFTLAKA